MDNVCVFYVIHKKREIIICVDTNMSRPWRNEQSAVYFLQAVMLTSDERISTARGKSEGLFHSNLRACLIGQNPRRRDKMRL